MTLKQLLIKVCIAIVVVSDSFLLGYMPVKAFCNSAFTLNKDTLTVNAFPFVDLTLNIYQTDNLVSEYRVPANEQLKVPLTQLAEGSYRANLNLPIFSTSLTFNLDKTAPIITSSYDKLTKDPTTPILINTNEAATLSIVSVDKGLITQVFDTDNVQIDLPIYEGENIFKITANDASGNQSNEEINIIGDFTPPTIKAITESGIVYGKDVDLKFNIQDNYQLASVSINGIENDVISNGEYSMPVAVQPGQNQFTVIATDKVGNTTEQLFTFDFQIKEPSSVPILMFHHISAQQVENNSLSETLFEDLLIWLRDNGYTTISFKELDDHLLEDKAIPNKSVILSFDDGYWNNYTNAFRLLKEYNMRGTFGVIPSLVGTWAHGIRWYMNWDEIKEMSAAGMEIVSHTYTHPYLNTVNNSQLKHELLDSKLEIEKQTGKSVETLFYPSGAYNSHVVALAKQYGYKSARVNWAGAAANINNMYAMPVIRVNWGDKAAVIGSRINNISKQ